MNMFYNLQRKQDINQSKMFMQNCQQFDLSLKGFGSNILASGKEKIYLNT